MDDYPDLIKLADEVLQAVEQGLPIVALESTVITHGLPYPENLQLAKDMESEIRQQQAIPATVGVLNGQVYVGLDTTQLTTLAHGTALVKVSVRDFGPTAAKRLSGGTTVAGTLVAAHLAGLKVFATGGIGGVHRAAPFDVSTDLMQLARTPMIVVCKGDPRSASDIGSIGNLWCARHRLPNGRISSVLLAQQRPCGKCQGRYP